MTIKPWRATCIQMKSRRAVDAPDNAAARLVIEANLAHFRHMVESACLSGQKPDLVVFPEFGMQGPPLDMPVADWIERACDEIPGWQTAALQQIARERGIFIAGNMFEKDPAWPGRYFNSSFLIDRTGEVVCVYKRINTAAFPSPHDFLDDYFAHTPFDEIFPVVETELGRLCLIPCGEINVPEVARIMMMQGAEVILHPTNSKKTAMQEATKRARAAENMTYLVSANVAGNIGFSRDPSVVGGRSEIIDYRGNTMAILEGPEESVTVTAMIDIEALRAERRADTTTHNPIIRNRFEAYAPFYASARGYPANGFLETPMGAVSETASLLEKTILHLEETRVLQRQEL
ncbi:nitrilase-related carbon-nitrogen hydrolase [Rhizobium halophytocola]|uniref:Amidohydrolase n=1 Tax=Rhizobium halophytocola TaxID=735519 RepID=A0ABS4DU34_9HYPH|nr:nitrilase-related carbon-nitrogen hydrolase [Rhizobium halophytocola]MBP1849209.1 putative amidohydrolase [Rhizobium halophytocola]